MEATGFVFEYKVNRQLTNEEREKHLLLSEPGCAEPDSQKSVIRMNSTYLELTDKFFESRGLPTAFALPMIGLMAWFSVFALIVLCDQWTTQSSQRNFEGLTALTVIYAMVLPMIWFLWKRFLAKEIFRYTHYPIRFNRKNRKVYVFRRDGSIMSENWDKLYFTLAKCKDYMWEVRGYRMADDGETVLEAFPLPYHNTLKANKNGQSLVLSQWEFVRRYMEQGPEVLAGDLKQVLRIENQKEFFWSGCARLVQDVFAANRFLGLIMLPLNLVIAIGRWIVMRTCKIPEWSSDVEEECEVELSDPYIFDSSTRFERVVEI